MAWEGGVIRVPGGAPPESILQILALLRYQIRLTKSSVAVAALAVNWHAGYSKFRGETMQYVPDREDVGVFFGSIFTGTSRDDH